MGSQEPMEVSSRLKSNRNGIFFSNMRPYDVSYIENQLPQAYRKNSDDKATVEMATGDATEQSLRFCEYEVQLLAALITNPEAMAVVRNQIRHETYEIDDIPRQATYEGWLRKMVAQASTVLAFVYSEKGKYLSILPPEIRQKTKCDFLYSEGGSDLRPNRYIMSHFSILGTCEYHAIEGTDWIPAFCEKGELPCNLSKRYAKAKSKISRKLDQVGSQSPMVITLPAEQIAINGEPLPEAEIQEYLHEILLGY